MFTTRWRLFRLLGIPIYVDASWLIILALLTISLASRFPALLHETFPETTDVPSRSEFWALGLLAAVAFFACILLHELGHAVVARARGMTIRGITLFMFGGVAEIGGEPPSAATEFLMAIGGPIVSVILAGAFWFSAKLGQAAGWSHAIVIVLGYLATINAIVLAFNLIPAFPLDGGRVLRSILWAVTGNLRRATWWAALAGQAFAWLLIALGVLQFFAGNWLGGVWTGIIGLFLNNAARGSYQQVLIRQALEGEPVYRFMNPHPITVPPAINLLHWVEDYVYRYHRKTFPVVQNERLVGCIETQALTNISRSEWDHRTVAEVMRTDLDTMTIRPDADALAALGKMQNSGLSRLLVVDAGRLVGMVSLKDLLRFLNLKLELGPAGPPSERRVVEPERRDHEELAHH
ncbi:MAG: site-2 protease family protein [Gemmataceae bacterium]